MIITIVRRGDVGNFDGVSRFTFNLAKGLRALGHYVYIISGQLREHPAKYYEIRDLNIIALGHNRNAGPIRLTYEFIIRGGMVLKRLDADYVIANGAIPILIDSVKVAVNHGNAISEYRNSLVKRLYGRTIYRLFNAVICVSEKVRKEMNEVGIKCHRVIPIPLILSEHYCTNAKENYLLFVGGDPVRKRLDIAVEATKKLRNEGFNIYLVVVGPRNNCPSKDFVICKGVMSDNELKELYAKALALILPSQWEGLPYTVLEAQASCTPAIVGPGVPDDVIINMTTGYKINSFNPRDYAEAIAKLLRDEALYNSMIKNTRKYAENFDHIKIASKYLELYHELQRKGN